MSKFATADRLRGLARAVRRIGASWRGDPEAIVMQKDAVAAELLAIAVEIETQP